MAQLQPALADASGQPTPPGAAAHEAGAGGAVVCDAQAHYTQHTGLFQALVVDRYDLRTQPGGGGKWMWGRTPSTSSRQGACSQPGCGSIQGSGRCAVATMRARKVRLLGSCTLCLPRAPGSAGGMRQQPVERRRSAFARCSGTSSLWFDLAFTRHNFMHTNTRGLTGPGFADKSADPAPTQPRSGQTRPLSNSLADGHLHATRPANSMAPGVLSGNLWGNGPGRPILHAPRWECSVGGGGGGRRLARGGPPPAQAGRPQNTWGKAGQIYLDTCTHMHMLACLRVGRSP